MEIKELTQTPLQTFELEELTDYTTFVRGTIISIDGKPPLVAGDIGDGEYFYVDRDGTLNYTPGGWVEELVEDNMYNHKNEYLYEFFGKMEGSLRDSLYYVGLNLDDDLEWNGNIRCLPDGDILDAGTGRKPVKAKT